jgi:hypothetical protein
MNVMVMAAWVGAAISLWGTGRYAVEVMKGHAKPRLASWIAWGTANGVLAVVALINDNPAAALFNALAAAGNVGVLVLSGIKRSGERPDTFVDWACLVVSGMCLATILTFPHATYLDAMLAMAANLVATWPTIEHAWRKPREEAWQLFAANGVANGLGLVGVVVQSGMSLGNIAGPLVSMVGNVALVTITVGRSWLMAASHEVKEEIVEAERLFADSSDVALD